MEKKISKNRQAGITVFLSLTLLIILALLGTMVEVTRGKVCRIHGRRTLKAATDSLLTEYSRPLYDEYHLFFLEDAGTPFATEISEYAVDTLEPGDGILGRRTDLYDGVLTDVNISDKRYVGDNECEAMKQQICEYMKRAMVTEALTSFQKKTDSIQHVENAALELEKKAEEEKKYAQSSKILLELMKQIDGVSYSGGKISGEKYFVKMFVLEERRSESLGITEAMVWNAIKEKVVSVEKELDTILQKGKATIKFKKQIQNALKKAEESIEILGKMENHAEQVGIHGDARKILLANKKILEETKGIIQQENITEDEVKQLKNRWRDYNTSGIVFDYTGIGENGGMESPMESFKEIISNGLTPLVVKDFSKLSQKEVENPDNYYQLYKDKNEEENYEKNVQNFAEKEEVKLQGAVKDIAQISTTNFMLAQYMKDYFSNVKNPVGDMEKRLDYEWEYIVCGENSDQANLEQVINRIVLMRTVINTGILMSSSAKKETAYAAALAIVGFTGMEPLVRLTQTMLLVLWGMAESLVDVAAILQDKKVLLVKKEKDFAVDFYDLYKISNLYIQGEVKKKISAEKTDFGYEEYLMLFVAANGSAKTCYRMMDLMEWNIKDNHVKNFNLGICVDSFSVTGAYIFGTKFFQMPFVQQVLERKLELFRTRAKVNAGYVEN